jgi:hypothetical protein
MNNCLDEDNNLWLAQSTIEAIHKTVQKAVAVGVEDGSGAWRVRDVAPAARCMAACWNETKPEEFYARYLTDRVGKPRRRLWNRLFAPWSKRTICIG